MSSERISRPSRATRSNRGVLTSLRHGSRLARTEFTRALRKYTARRSQLVLYGLLLVASVGWFGFMSYLLSDELTTGDLSAGFSAMEILHGVVGLLTIFFAFMFFIRAVGQRGTLAHPEGTLTVVPTRDAVVGVLLSEFLFYLLYMGPTSLAIGVGLAVGGGFTAAIVLAPLVFVGLGVVAVAIGFPLGLAVRHIVTRIPFIARHKNALIIVVFVAYLAFLMTGQFEDIVVVLFEPLQSMPFSGFADLLFITTPALDPDSSFALTAVTLTVLLAIVAVAVATLLAQRHWFSDPVLAGEVAPAEPTEPVGESRVERALTGPFGRKTATLVALAWRRALRAPLKLMYAAYPLFFLAGFAPTVFESGAIPAELPLAVLLIVTWGAGVAFALNPLGDQGSVLPATLLSAVDGSTFVRATALASLAIAIPLGVVATAVVAFLSPLEPTRMLALVIAAPVVITLSTFVAVAIGMVFPRFTAISVTRSTKAVVPSLFAFAVYSIYLLATALFGAIVADELVRTVAALFVSWLLPFGLSIAPGQLYWVAGALLVPLVLAPVAAYRYATRRFDRYVLG